MAKTGVGSTRADSTPQWEAKPREVGITDRVVLLCLTSWKIDRRMKSTERPFLSPIAHSFILSVCYCYSVVENATGGPFWPSLRLFDCTVSSNLSFLVFFPFTRGGGRGVSGGCALSSLFARHPR